MADQCACNLAAPECYHDLACFTWLGWASSPLDALLPLLCTLYRIRMREQCTGLNLDLKKVNVSPRIRTVMLPGRSQNLECSAAAVQGAGGWDGAGGRRSRKREGPMIRL